MTKKILIIFLLIINVRLSAQTDFPLKDRYPFVRYDKNKFLFPGDTKAFDNLFSKFDTLLFYGTNYLTVVQIGASHTQADIFTGELRTRLQTMYPGLSAGRGYVFPYNLIRTNSPSSYRAYHTGRWEVCRNVERRICNLGLTGIMATTSDPEASITIKLKDTKELQYEFNYVKVLHSTDNESFKLRFAPDSLIIDEFTNAEMGYSEFWLKKSVKEAVFRVEASDISETHFTLYGIFLENMNPGIIFNPIGINGASTTSYNKAPLFTSQLQALSPDWVIIALGTNDGYTASFDSAYFRGNFKQLIRKIKAANEDIAITIIVPNDDYFKRRYPNPNTARQAEILLSLAKEENCAVWNMYEIMGGYNSSSLWLSSGLMTYDRIHFTRAGYIHLADLFFMAMMEAYGEAMNKGNL